jgi:hypothetical protein
LNLPLVRRFLNWSTNHFHFKFELFGVYSDKTSLDKLSTFFQENLILINQNSSVQILGRIDRISQNVNYYYYYYYYYSYDDSRTVHIIPNYKSSPDLSNIGLLLVSLRVRLVNLKRSKGVHIHLRFGPLFVEDVHNHNFQSLQNPNDSSKRHIYLAQYENVASRLSFDGGMFDNTSSHWSSVDFTVPVILLWLTLTNFWHISKKTF